MTATASLRDLRWLRLARATFLLSGIAFFSPGLGAQPGGADAPSRQMIGYVRIKPLQPTLQRAAAVAGEFDPTGMSAALPGIVGQQLGDFTLQSVSSEENIALFFYRDSVGGPRDPEFGFLALARLTPDSPIKQNLARNLDLAVEDRAGWTLIGSSPAVLAETVDLRQLINLTTADMTADLEVRFLTASNLDLLTNEAGEFEFPMPAPGDEGQEQSEAGGRAVYQDLVDLLWPVLLEEARSIPHQDIRLTLDPELIRLVVATVTEPESPLGHLLSGPAGGAVPDARYLRGRADIRLVYSAAVEPQLAYFAHIRRRVAASAESQEIDASELLEAWRLFEEITALSDGRGAVLVNFDGLGRTNSNQINGGRFTDESLRTFLGGLPDAAATFTRWMFSTPAAPAGFGDETGDFVRFESEVAVHRERPIHSLRTDPVSFLDPDARAALLDQGIDLSELAETDYYAVYDGTLVVASSIADIRVLLNRLIDDTPVENSLADILTLPDRVAFRMTLDPVGLLRSGTTAERAMTAAEFDALATSLGVETVDPLQIAFSQGNAQSLFTLDFPVSAIRAFMALAAAIEQAAQSEEL